MLLSLVQTSLVFFSLVVFVVVIVHLSLVGGSFLIESYIIPVEKKLEHFGQYLKNGFPIVFSKSDLAGLGGCFFMTCFSKKAKHLGICRSFGGNVGQD